MCVFFAQNPATTTDWCNVDRAAIDILPNDVLLEIFDFLVAKSNRFEAENWWLTLVHVCRKWRIVIFGSPHSLNLQLVCSDGTPVREMLDVWPPWPIVVHHFARPMTGWDNITAALGCNDRVRQIGLELDPQWEKVLEAMQKPFPALTHLSLLSDTDIAPVVPDLFMGGSAPRLQHLRLKRIPILGLPKLLSSATDLSYLDLRSIPHSGYISPEAIVTCLSALPRLEKLCLEFESPRSFPNRASRRLLSRPTRSVLPSLTRLYFTGVSEYLEDLVARIDSPLLSFFDIRLFHQLIFDTPQLTQFITRTPELKTCDEAHVYFSNSEVWVTCPRTPPDSDNGLQLAISCGLPEWQLSAMEQVCGSSFPQSLIRKVEQLYIYNGCDSRGLWQDDIETSQWLELLHPFMAAKHLYLSKELVPLIAPSFQELMGEGATEVLLPALKSLFLEFRPSRAAEEAIGKFLDARELFNLPVSISHWVRSDNKW